MAMLRQVVLQASRFDRRPQESWIVAAHEAWQSSSLMKKARALRLIRRLKAAEAPVSGWEGEFLDSVETRLDTYGRAFADPEKGDRDHALSNLQQRKLKEIRAKVSGEEPAARKPAARSGFGPRKPWGRAGKAVPSDPDEGDGG